LATFTSALLLQAFGWRGVAMTGLVAVIVGLPAHLYLTVNLKTAAELGITVPRPRSSRKPTRCSDKLDRKQR
jgi:hypothetical protein